jgi:hypothetical protein
MKYTTPTQQDVIEYFDYRDGRLYWKKIHTNNQVKKGQEAGYIDNRYMRVGFMGKYYLVHRLIWLYVYGYMPRFIDHINHDRSDNRIENLREATIRDNNTNRSQRKDNTSGVTGVSWYKNYGKWSARINTGNKRVLLGYFDTVMDAKLAREQALVKYGYHKNHGVKTC